MPLHEALVAELANNTETNTYVGAVSPRVFPYVIPQKKPGGPETTPGVTYEQTGCERGVSYCGTDRLVKTTLDIKSWSPLYNTAKLLAAAVKDVLIDFSGSLGGTVRTRAVSLENDFDMYDPDPGLHGVVQTWVFWHVEE